MNVLATVRRWFARLREPEPLGARGETVAARYLRRHGYKIVARGQRDNLGELDLIAVDGRTVVFVEVKTRGSDDKGHPSDAVDDDKQRRLTRLALAYLRRHHLLETAARFDVMAIIWPEGHKRPSSIQHIRNAFEAVGQGQLFS